MTSAIPSDVLQAFQTKYEWLKNEQFPSVGAPDSTGIYKTPDGGWQQWFGNCATIVLRPGDTIPHEVHGAICERWAKEGGAWNEKKERGWLGYPVSDEEVYADGGDSEDRISHFENGDIIWTAKTVETRVTNIKDRSKWYETRRNELLALLKKASGLDLPEKYAGELCETARKCQEDAFEIALVGEFQGGKSTTFNALCDGRDISPRGLGGAGIKTSAAVISAQNIAGDETKEGLTEWAEVTFRGPGNIALGISTILRPAMMDTPELRQLNRNLSDEEYANAIATDDGFPELVDLGNSQCLELLRKTAKELWELWENDRANALDQDQLDQLRIATLQLRFWGTEEHRQLLEQTIWAIDQFQKLVAFPPGWETRWRKGFNAPFDFGEVGFVFVHSVLVRIHSETLQRLGCRITDCPGLFANAFDTSVAERAIRHADAVWYLVNGEYQLGDKDKKCIQTIASWGFGGKIQATANIRSKWKIKSTTVLDATKDILYNMGLSFDVIPYHARLAFLAAQGKLLLEHPDSFTELDKANMAIDANSDEDAPPAHPSQMWPDMVQEIGYTTHLNELKKVTELTDSSVRAVRNASHFGKILGRLENDVVPKKAQSILVNRGSKRALDALVAYEGVLRATERTAAAEEAKWRAELKKARQQLIDFVQGANKIIDRSVLNDGLDPTSQSFANEIVKKALDDEYVDNLSEHFAEKVLDAEFSWKQTIMLENIKRDVVPVFANDSKAALSRALEVWKTGQGLRKLHQSLNFVCDDIHDLWQERKIDAVEMLEGFESPRVAEEDINSLCDNLSEAICQNQQMQVILKAFKNIWKEMARRVLDSLGDLLQRIWAEIYGKANNDDRPMYDYHEKMKQKRSQRIDDIKSKSKDKIKNAVNDVRFQEQIKQVLEKQLREALGRIGEKLRTRLKGLKTDFEKERVEEPERLFGQSTAERKRIAKENKALRTRIITPLRKQIDLFKTAVSAEL